MPDVDIIFPGTTASVQTIAALRALDSEFLTVPTSMFVNGGTTFSDGLGGVFTWNSGSVATDDGKNVIKPNDRTSMQAGRWIRVDGAAVASIDLSNVAGISEVDPNFEGSGVAAWLFDLINFVAANPQAADAASFTFLRRSPTGGTPGSTNSAVRVIQTTEPGTASFEWALLTQMHNYSTGGQNVGAYFIGYKHSTGPTWGGLFEVIETTAVNNPINGSLACELDVSGNGTDNVYPYARVGADLAIRKFDPTGVDLEAGWGYRIQNGGNAGSLVRIAFGLYDGMRAGVAFDCSKGTVLEAALRMAAGVPIAFDAGSQHLLKYDNSGLAYLVAGVQKFRLNANATLDQAPLTVATLPAAGSSGRRAFVTDANASTFYTAVAGGGTNRVPVFDDGSIWRIG